MLEIRKLTTPLIGPIDLMLEPGTCSAISGASGAGKSLFLRAIADLDDNSGQISLGGTVRSEMPAPDWRRKVAYIPAESGWWAERVADHFDQTTGLGTLLDAVGLADALSWEVSRLSTGERQRLALVRALQTDPKVLLLDEPTSALDPPSVERVEALLKERLASGSALLLVTHDPGQPKRFAARRYHMASGKLSPLDQPEKAS
ncbi:ABC transporter ATP-binding protein [Roseibium sp. CAU 1639]|uniref:ABC transporter ATP-binding protein n=1 Tax=Roseibium sediminicola TaxID=2933272 RepID=A0ABT0H1E6_9HYPH|nr:ABC transporter ATP-binding protein [Roseibium sp. CAU 1639]